MKKGTARKKIEKKEKKEKYSEKKEKKEEKKEQQEMCSQDFGSQSWLLDSDIKSEKNSGISCQFRSFNRPVEN